jgi:glutathione synthase/RimK-type ligase-like ATP-grasp enzyme
MPHIVAIQPDRSPQTNGETQSFSDRWAVRAAETGVVVRAVNVYARDFFEQLDGCDGFMWRFGYSPNPRLFAKRLLPAIEHGLGIPVFPSFETVWHFEDKIAQSYLLQAAGLPTPATWVFWDRTAALDFCRSATYPLVLKLFFGYQSGNVRLLNSFEEASCWIARLFGPGVTGLQQPATGWRDALHRLRHLRSAAPYTDLESCELQHGYFYAQEFVPGNAYDIRVTVIGNRAFAFRRFNRAGDFRASGSGRIDWNPHQIEEEHVWLAFRAARHLRTQSLAVDLLQHGERKLLTEISYTYASWAVRDCPGHWVLRGDANAGESLSWVEGRMHPEDAIFDDFVACLRSPEARVPAGFRTSQPAHSCDICQ